MNDYSEVTATLGRRVSFLINLLNDKKWVEAKSLAVEIEGDMNRVVKWVDKTEGGLCGMQL